MANPLEALMMLAQGGGGGQAPPQGGNPIVQVLQQMLSGGGQAPPQRMAPVPMLPPEGRDQAMGGPPMDDAAMLEMIQKQMGQPEGPVKKNVTEGEEDFDPATLKWEGSRETGPTESDIAKALEMMEAVDRDTGPTPVYGAFAEHFGDKAADKLLGYEDDEAD